jgi:prenyltransferase beta subunit
MLQVARLAPRLLGDSGALVRDYLYGELHTEGGFRDRAGQSDLYYTVFGLDALLALQAEVPTHAVRRFLTRFGAGDSLDLVHLASLARCWAATPPPRLDPVSARMMGERLEVYRSSDGGYHARPGAPRGTTYHAFLALGAYEDLGLAIPRPEALRRSLESLQSSSGGFSNTADAAIGATPATAAAVLTLRHLDAEVPADVRSWLLHQWHDAGGFVAAPGAPLPDLLSTATALHALAALHAPLEPIAERCLDFIDTLWTSRGAFYGTWADEEPDCEYTYYGLLALGHLSLAA